MASGILSNYLIIALLGGKMIKKKELATFSIAAHLPIP